MNNKFNIVIVRTYFVIISLLACAQSLAQSETLPFLEGNPIWVYKHEHIPRGLVWEDDGWYYRCWLDAGDRSYSYYFIGDTSEIEGTVYTMMGEVKCNRDGGITLGHLLPVREENGIVYAFTDSLPGVVEYYYDEDTPMPYLQQGKECILYNFSTKIGETLYPQNEGSIVKSFDTYQLLDGMECRVLKTNWGRYDLYERLGFCDDFDGIMDPFLSWPIPTNGHVYESCLNAFYQDNVLLYKAPDAPEGLFVNDTCWTFEDADVYARSYKSNSRQEEVFSFIRHLQGAFAGDFVTFTKGQMATIILPTEPDASKGKFYRLDRCEKGQIIFEEEPNPKARTPYIIVPNEDFSIDLSTLELNGLSRDTVAIEGISFIGSYVRDEFCCQDGHYIDIIDTTPDCMEDESVIGALRAYLEVDWKKLGWDDPYDGSGTISPAKKMKIVLSGHGTGIRTNQWQAASSSWQGHLYDLQGRHLTDRPSRGIYIEGGRGKVLAPGRR